MKILKKIYFTAILLIIMTASSFATDIAGIINKYSLVTNINKTGSYVEAEKPEYFNFCDLVLLIQMTGAEINTTNTNLFGKIESRDKYKSAGNYEFLVISKIEGNKIYFSSEIKRTYQSSEKVQLIKVPTYINATVTDTLLAEKWNGSTGGVLALKVDSILTLNKPIKASGCGFSGAMRFGDETNTNDQPNYFYSFPSWQGALKGDGISIALPSYMQAGRGAPANAGGGGNNHNGGGGGGANAGRGGKGGLCWNKRLDQSYANDYGGIGGWALDYSNDFNKIFLGGGGGAGHSNASDNVSTKGEDGGGIIIIIANKIVGNSQYIISSGNNAIEGGNDGSGGGGSGGTILLDVSNYQGVLSVYARGGNGGDNDGSKKPNDLVGPGGGGGGGLIWHKNATLPSGVSASVMYGFNGIITNPNITVDYQENYGAQAGAEGLILKNLAIEIPAMPDIKDIDLSPISNGPLCPQETLKLLSGLPDSLKKVQIEWKGPNGFFSNEADPIREYVSNADSGWYHISISICGNIVTDSVYVKILGAEVEIIPKNALLCENDSLTLRTKAKYTSYKWSTGAVTDTIIVTKPGEYSVVTVDSNGCTTEDRIFIEIIDAPKPTILPEQPEMCVGDTVHIWVSEDYLSYKWSTGDTTKKIVANKGGFFSVTVIDANGCKGKAEIFVKSLPKPVPDIQPKNPAICSNGGSVELFIVQDYPSIRWFNGQTTKSIRVTSPGTYNVTVTDSNGCVGTASIIVGVIKAPEPYIVPANPKICRLDSVLLNTEKQYSSYLWSTGETSEFIIVKALGKYSVTVVDEYGCTGKAEVEVTEFQLNPQIIGGKTICIKDSVKLQTFDSYKKYRWSTGDTTPSITVFNDGVYELDVEDEKGCTGKVSVKVHIGDPPEPKIEFIGNHPFCSSDDFWLQTTEEFASYQWSSGHNARKIKPTYGGTYVVTVTDSNGCSGTAKIDIEMYPQPKPIIEIIGENPFCENDSVTLVAQGNFLDYKWSTGETTKQIVVKKAQIVTMTVTDSNYCKGTAQVILRNKDLSIKINIIGPYPICDGDSIILRPNKQFSSYLWSTGDTSNQIVVLRNGDFWLLATDKDGCSGYSDTVKIIFSKAPDPEIHGPLLICKNTTANYWVKIEDEETLTYWKVFDGKLLTSDFGDSIKVQWEEKSSGRVIVSRKFVNSQCITNDTLIVKILDTFNPGIFALSQYVCEGGTTTLWTEEGYESYEWSNGSSEHSITIDKPGKYWVKVTASDGCDGMSDTLEIFFAEAVYPKIDFKGILCFGDSLLLSVTEDFSSYEWSNGDTVKQIFIRQPGEYIVTVKNNQGCIGRDTVVIEEFKTELTLKSQEIFFGEILLNNIGAFPLEILNSAKNEVSLNKIYLKNSNTVFSFKNVDNLPMILIPSEKITIPIEFIPRKPGKYSDSIIFEVDSPCKARFACYVEGIGYAETLVWLPEIKARIGDTNTCIPIMGRYNFDYDSTLVLSYETDISFLLSLFNPELFKICILDNKQKNNEYLQLSLSGTNLTFTRGDNILGSFCGSVFLGDSIITQLKFDKFRWINPYIYVELVDGKLITDGICMPDLSRIQRLNPTNFILAPNPVKGIFEVEIVSEEIGIFQLSAYNINGIRVQNYDFENIENKSISRKIVFDMQRYANGVYFLVLRSPWNITAKQFILLKD